MNKSILMVVFFALLACTTQAQTFGEWFNQKKTQKKYLIQQIAELEIYYQWLKKGYNISQKGLMVIGNIKNGDWTMHSDYFASLKTVNPKVGAYAKVGAIMALGNQILTVYKTDLQQARTYKSYHGEEIDYMTRVYDQVISDVSLELKMLNDILTNGKFTMKDAERIEEIDSLYFAMQRRFVFVKKFSEHNQISTTERKQEQSGNETLQQLYKRDLP